MVLTAIMDGHTSLVRVCSCEQALRGGWFAEMPKELRSPFETMALMAENEAGPWVRSCF